jgi:hypothetical protein
MSLLNAYANGALRLEMLYVELFGKLPDNYYYYNENQKFDTFCLTKKKCREVFGEDIDVKISSQDKIYSTSKAEEEDSYSWDENSQSFKKNNYPYVIIYHYVEKWILAVADDSIQAFSYDFDIKNLVKDVIEWLPQQEKQSKTASIDLVAFDNHYYTINSKIKRTEVNFDTHYNDDIKDMYKELLTFLNERESGLAVLHGAAGSGKTYFIKNLISSIDKQFILVTNAIAAHMAEPEFIAFMLENKDSIFILEDCEQILMSREENRFGGAISNILNMSDGLMSDIFNIKFICTFNTDINNIDEALLRPGRCFVNYEFKPLEAEKTSKLLESLGYTIDKSREMTLAEIYNYKEETVKSITRKIGF